MKITFKTAIELNIGIGSCINNGLSVNSILSLIDLKDELSNIIEKYNKAINDIMKNNNIEKEDGKYSWKGNVNQEKISSYIDELITSEIEVFKFNCLSSEEIIKLTNGLNIDTI